jgi:hypothetical protein
MILSNFNLENHQVKTLERSIGNLRAHSKLEFRILENNSFSYTIQVKQIEATDTGRIFTQKELVERASGIFGLIEGYTFKYIPVTYSPDFSIVNVDWINDQMKEFDLKNSDISRQTGIDKSTLSLLFTGRKNFTLIHKALFYFYFDHYRVSKNCREIVSNLQALPE